MQALGIPYEANQWCLFSDCSKLSIKCVLLHNANLYAAIPNGYAVKMKEMYQNMKLLL